MFKTNCLTADMLKVGDRFEKSLAFTHDQVARYCEVTSDHNAIHREVEAARLRFPDVKDIVVPGGLIQTRITGIFGSEFPGDGCVGLSFVPERFRSPVCPDDEIRVIMEISRIRGPMLAIEIVVEDESGNRLSNAKATVLAPDEAYRDWWSARFGAN